MPRPAVLWWTSILLGISYLPTQAQPYARLDVPDSSMTDVLQAQRVNFENSWNALLVTWLRASAVGADSSIRLQALAERIARGEPAALGSSISGDALKHYRGASPREIASRIHAAVDESLATVARDRGDAFTADSLFREALATYRHLDERRRVAWVLGSLGGIALTEQLDAEADSILLEALAARRAIGDERMIGNSLYDLGQANYRLGRFENARHYFDESLRIRERTGQTAQRGSTLAFLGATLAALGQPDSAWACFDRGIALTSAAGDSNRTLDALVTNVVSLVEHGEHERAMTRYARARVIAEELERYERLARLESILGGSFRRSTRFTEAFERYQAAVDLQRDLGLDRDRAVTLNEIGRLWLALGDHAPALGPLTQARGVADSLEDVGLRATILINLSWAAQMRGDLAGARRLASQALAAAAAVGDSQRVHDAAAQLADVQIDRGELASGEAYLQRALGAGSPGRIEERAADLVQIAMARQLGGRLDEAERDLHRVLEIAGRAGLPEVESSAWVNLGDVAERRGHFTEALERYSRALDLIDTLRVRQGTEAHAITAFANRLAPYEAIIHLLGKLDARSPDSGYAARAFHWAERARARVLLDQAAAVGEEARVARVVSIEEAQRLLPPRSALLHYSVGDSSTSLWVVRADGWRHFRLGARSRLVARIKAFRTGIATLQGATSVAFRESQRALYATLVAPAESLLAGIDELLISPDGALAQLPFEALRIPSRSGGRASFMVERFAISYIPSVSLLAVLDSQPPSREIVAIGNPDFGRVGLPPAAFRGIGGIIDTPKAGAPPSLPPTLRLAPLPGTARELKALEAMAMDRRVVRLSGRQASRSRLIALPELSTAAIVHIATHGVASELEPARSGLWLAAEEDSGMASFLGVPEVSRLRLRASLVTLSACETALGRVERGEGVVGLARGFLAAGVRSVVVSQWRVADRPTAALMERFYKGLLVENRSRAQSLAEAKRALLAQESTRSPHFWAPFVLVGRSGLLE